MRPLLFEWIALAAAVTAAAAAQGWKTVYAAKQSVAYLQLTDGSLVSIPTNQSFTDPTDAANHLSTVAPPTKSSPQLVQIAVVDSETLLAFYPASGSDSCSSPVSVSAYDAGSNSWTKLASSDQLYTQNATVWSYPYSDSAYIFGGQACDQSISGQMVSFNYTAKAFVNVTANEPPTPLEAASACAVSNSSVVLLGGKASNGWIAMTQIAVWDSSTWTYRTAGNATNIDSRTDALVLPVYDTSGDSSGGDSGAGAVATGLIVIGGSVTGRAAKPPLAQLQLPAQGAWKWTVPGNAPSFDGILGALTIANTLVTIGNSVAKRWRRGGGYALSFIDLDTWQTTNSLAAVTSSTAVASTTSASSTSSASASATASAAASASASATAAKSGLSTGAVAAISTVLPLSVGALAGLGIYYAWRKRQRADIPQSPFVTKFPDEFPSQTNHDAASIESWTEKRDWYVKNTVPLTNVPSNQTIVNNRLSFPASIGSATTVTRRIVSQGAPGTPGTPGIAEPRSRVVSGNSGHDSDSENDDFFDQRDVQVLVSSLRRKKLVVTNPDEPEDLEVPDAPALREASKEANPKLPELPALHTEQPEKPKEEALKESAKEQNPFEPKEPEETAGGASDEALPKNAPEMETQPQVQKSQSIKRVELHDDPMPARYDD